VKTRHPHSPLSQRLRRELPGPLFVQEGPAHAGDRRPGTRDDASARTAFIALGKDAPPGRALEVERWLDRLEAWA